MTWIVFAVGVFFSSTFLYLVLRKLSFLKVNNEIQNLFLFLPAVIVLYFYSITNRYSLFLTVKELTNLIIASFSIWIGNVAMLRSLKNAPNAGYPVLIGKSYVLITILLSPILFGSILTLKSTVLIILILFFISQIIIDKVNKNSSKKSEWILPAFIAFLFWGIMALLMISLKRPSLAPEVIIMYLSIFASIIIGVEMVIRRIPIKPVVNHFGWLIFLGIIGLFLNIFFMIGYRVSPNPGYMDAVGASSVAAITLFSVILFKDEITLKKTIGIVGVILCLIFLLI